MELITIGPDSERSVKKQWGLTFIPVLNADTNIGQMTKSINAFRTGGLPFAFRSKLAVRTTTVTSKLSRIHRQLSFSEMMRRDSTAVHCTSRPVRRRHIAAVRTWGSLQYEQGKIAQPNSQSLANHVGSDPKGVDRQHVRRGHPEE